jgi:putative FmdB family regulatory protein
VPLYDYKCRGGHRFEAMQSIEKRLSAVCPTCGARSAIQILKAPAAVLFHAGVYDNLDVDPIYCETAQELRDACDKRDLRSVYLENSSFRTKETVQDIQREIYADDERKARSQEQERRD